MEQQKVSKNPQNPRTITVFSTKGKSQCPILEKCDVSTWGQLKGILSSKGVDYGKMKAVVGHSKVTLEHNDAALPETDFTLFLMPFKTKSGRIEDVANAKYWDIRKEIARIFEQDETAARNHFNDEGGRNYTNKKTVELKALLISWYENNPESSEQVIPSDNGVADVVETVKQHKEEELPEVKEEVIEENNFDELVELPTDKQEEPNYSKVIERLGKIQKHLGKIAAEDMPEDVAQDISNMQVATSELITKFGGNPDQLEREAAEKAQKEEEERLAKEKAEEEARIQKEKDEADKARRQALKNQANDLASGFQGLDNF